MNTEPVQQTTEIATPHRIHSGPLPGLRAPDGTDQTCSGSRFARHQPVPTSVNATADVALGYADRGWKVFPVRRDKTPYTDHGYKSATTDAAQIQSWWTRYPSANIGVACDASELLVLDIDPRNGGDRTLAELESEYGQLPHGPRSRTGGGGSHYFYTAPGFRPAGKLGDGVDVKYHGYVILPPSLHEAGGRYEWLIAPDEAALPTLPDAWCSLLLTGRPSITAAGTTRSLAYRDGGPILEGSRDNTLTQIAGAMRRASVSPEGIEAALRVENAKRCRPPMSDADMHRIATSVGRYPSGPPWMLDPVTFASGSDLTHTEWSVLIVLCRGADYDGYVYGGNWIGEWAHLSYPTTYRALRGLQTKSRILLDEQGRCKDEHGHWCANRYQLVDQPAPFITQINNLPVNDSTVTTLAPQEDRRDPDVTPTADRHGPPRRGKTTQLGQKVRGLTSALALCPRPMHPLVTPEFDS